ncbi:hypothetical protein METBIDRAFT_12691 [Metschnikowia bicuspidata var. bicuspidata NRRL YB-4993]|uniref:PI31 proteasome regulator C-terminal domain-containing protein n=1 Tax=Metschnikowia bicuspidata var. bicuspidata NRRL YB-4993 TaxID=869754 RepID=A0A1A0H9R8_9ASCO|nr:hypothetical protein METBIDRAFT_12691 [Metschnikowia bicuspidata var. bicuspidata NRRL YB-4993]OBA20740.1 hypothetical protein METBIDRAFT_12691 [Metschnikowia bicuspidata var. bicuspidata NRRL YB-4993]
MYASGFKLILGLVRKYLAEKLDAEPSQSAQSLSSDTHAQWSVGGDFNKATITATRLTDENTILNFISGDDVRAVQVPLHVIGVTLLDDVDDISPDLVAAFTAHVDGKLHQAGGFWKLPPRKPEEVGQNPKNQDTEAPRLPAPLAPGAPLPGARQSASRTFSRPPDMPDFEDEYESKSRAGMTPQTGGFGIGDRDLNPPGLLRDPPMKPYLDPYGGEVAGGGMYPTGDHPMFGLSRGNTSRLGVPPGARFDDPYGEDNLEDMGMGLPGNMRHPPFGGPPGPPFGGPPGPPGPPFDRPPFGGPGGPRGPPFGGPGGGGMF